MSLVQINTNIKRVARNGAAFNTLVQDTAVLCIEHAMREGDANPAKRLVAAMPKSMRRGVLVRWFEKYSPIAISVDKDAKDGTNLSCRLHKPEARAFNNFNLDGARANNWFEMPEMEKEDLPTTLEDIEDRLGNVISFMERRLKDNKVLEADVPVFKTRLAAIKALAA